VGHAHPVANEQDDVAGLPGSGGVDVPGDGRGRLSVAGRDEVPARRGQADVPEEEGRRLDARLPLDEGEALPEDADRILTVDGDLDVSRPDDPVELDLEVEVAPGQDLGAVDRVDGAGPSRAWPQAREDAQASDDDAAHLWPPARW